MIPRQFNQHAASPSGIEQYRAKTAGMLWLNHAQKRCTGCKRSRSLGQFAEGDELCAQCRRRA